MQRQLGVTSKWLASGCNYSQMAAGKVTAFLGCFHAEKCYSIKATVGTYYESPLNCKQAILSTPAVYKLITSHSKMLLHFCNGRESSQLRPLEFWNRPLLNERDYHRS